MNRLSKNRASNRWQLTIAPRPVRVLITACLAWLVSLSGTRAADSSSRSSNPPSNLRFKPTANGEYGFDTGELRGLLRANGKSLGLSSLVHVPSGTKLDRSNGLLSYYRIFTANHRYGVGAWDWPSTATLLDDGAVEVRWPAAADRPFELQATHRWVDPSSIDVETVVQVHTNVSRMEVFLASYFGEGFTNAAAYVKETAESNGKPTFLAAKKAFGEWLMYPRDASSADIIRDGRWRLQPNPVEWTILPVLKTPLAYRRDPKTGLTAVLMAPPRDCFAIATPQEGEGHYSLYLSLFGRDLNAGESARARTRLWIAERPSDVQIFRAYRIFTKRRQ